MKNHYNYLIGNPWSFFSIKFTTKQLLSLRVAIDLILFTGLNPINFF